MMEVSAYIEAEKARLRRAIKSCREGCHAGIDFVAWDKEEADSLKAYMAALAPEIPFRVSWCEWPTGEKPLGPDL